jgi:hypothetical protein
VLHTSSLPFCPPAFSRTFYLLLLLSASTSDLLDFSLCTGSKHTQYPGQAAFRLQPSIIIIASLIGSMSLSESRRPGYTSGECIDASPWIRLHRMDTIGDGRLWTTASTGVTMGASFDISLPPNLLMTAIPSTLVNDVSDSHFAFGLFPCCNFWTSHVALSSITTSCIR